MPNATLPPPVIQQNPLMMNSLGIPILYWLVIFAVIFILIIGIILFIYRGPPTIFAIAALKRKDVLLVNMANNKIMPVIPKVVGDWYLIKSRKKKDAPGGYFYINQKSVTRMGNIGIAFANSHQAITIPMTSLEVMTVLQQEEKLGLKLNTFSKLDTVIKYGEILNEKEGKEETESRVDTIKDILDIKKEQREEDLKLKFAALVEEMRNLDHFNVFVKETKEGVIKPNILLSKDEQITLKKLIGLSKDNPEDLAQKLSETDLKLLSKAEGQLIRGQTHILSD